MHETTTSSITHIDADRLGNRVLSARLERFDSYWQAPEDVEHGYESFYAYYKANYIPHLPETRGSRILIISCGPGYLVSTLQRHGYEKVTGIDSDEAKIRHGASRGLDCRCAEAFPFLADKDAAYDVIIPEQELNHLTLEETIDFLRLCYRALQPGGKIIAYGLNGANPLVGSENLSHNIDHFNTYTEYSLAQVLQLGGFRDIHVFPLKLYVFWKNPLNYVGIAVTSVYETICRIMFKIYGKNVRILSKKIAATAIR